ncbi:M23 family metallopeptidase [Thalassococcus sp. S3]|uniref:M23 family metallopeptidase n=1 Tax=Thalassococcus sp. S3 TaxID=2017482 RepID=UPI001023F830|nr:M23 family metallopeptidase [Thalassococcus sp. S3]QBF30881.1 peptidase M24 [Thalassococcus sp. S3]
MFRAAVAACVSSLAGPLLASDLQLSLPIDCELGSECYIQQFVDHDPGPGARDFRCNGLSYDGHKGTDFALPTLDMLDEGVKVIASAPGTVRGFRDGMEDRLFGPDDAASLDGRDCGNGVVLQHANGWETQYCHLRKGSVRVQTGQSVERGEVLGEVGLSGRTQFPHLHLSVRHNGEVVDPFDAALPHECQGASDESLWDVTPSYIPGAILDVGLATDVPSYDAVKDGSAARDSLGADAAALVVYGFAFGGQTGDVMALTLSGPAGSIATHSTTLDRDQAQFFRATGKRLTTDRWPAGEYNGDVQLIRDGAVLDTQSVTISIP